MSPSMKQSELCCCFSVPLLWPPFCSLLFSHPCWDGLKFFPFLVHLESSLPCGIIVMRHEFCPFPAMCSSWTLFVTDSILCLVDSCASVIQLNQVFASDALAFFPFSIQRFPVCMLERTLFCMALPLPLVFLTFVLHFKWCQSSLRHSDQ